MNRQEVNKLLIENERLKNEIESLKKSGFKNKSMIDPDKHLFLLTVGEFLKLIEQPEPMPIKVTEHDFTDKKYAYGVAGIAQLFGCCRTTASRILNSGRIDKAVIRFGKKITVDAELAMKLIKQSE